jgi:hypothetical protein
LEVKGAISQQPGWAGAHPYRASLTLLALSGQES